MKYFLIFFLFCVSVNYSQKLKGIVYENVDGKTNTLPGVNIFWAGTTIGTSSDSEGQFEILKLAENEAKLVVTYVTYHPDTIIVKKIDEFIEITLTENKELEEITVSVKTKGSEFDDLSAILTQNLFQKEFKKAACCNLSESFETNASVDVSYGDAVTGSKQIKLLGLAGKYSQIMTENIPNLRGLATAYGIYYIPGPWMESIQISKGTASVINGYESTTGQINIQFKDAHTSDPLYADVFTTSSLKNDINLISTHKVTDHISSLLFLHGEYLGKNLDHNNDSFIDHPNVRQFNVLNKWSYEDHKNWHVAATLNYLVEERYGGQTGFGKTTNNQIYRTIINTNRFQFWSKVGYMFDNDVESSIGFISMFTKHNQNSSFGLTDFDSDEFSFYSNLIFESKLFNDKHKINTGLSLVVDNFDQKFQNIQSTKNEITPGIFLQYTYQPIEKLTFIGGIRGDHSNKFGNFVTPRAHIRYNPTATTSIRVSGGKGFRSANVIPENISYLATSRNFIIPSNLQMEEALNYGINLTQYFYLFDRELTINAEVYRTEFNNKIVVDIDKSFQEVNFYNLDGNSYSNNYQVEMNYEIIPQLDLLGAIRYSDAKTTIDGNLIEDPLQKKFKGLLSASYLTKLRLWQFDFTAQFNGESRIPKHYGKDADSYSPAFVNLMAQVTRYFRNWEVFMGIENLTDFTQDRTVISSDDPFGPNYDSSLIWGPLEGRKFYLGLRFSIK